MDILSGEREGEVKREPRNPVIAFFMSLVFPGLGQFYNGQPKKTGLMFGLLLVLPYLFGISRGVTFFYGYVALFVLEWVVRIYSMADAVMVAKRQQDFVPKSFNHWYAYLIVIVAMVGLSWTNHSSSTLGILSFKITAAGNSLTIQPGDRVVADMQAYDNHPIQYGDIVLFKKGAGEIWIFRVVGLPKDFVEIKNDVVTINGKPSNTAFVQEIKMDKASIMEYNEVLPGGYQYGIYKTSQPADTSKTSKAAIIVPEGSYYLLGDNRDNTSDSRYFGTVKKEDIIGRVVYSYWGEGLDRVNVDFR